MPPVLISPNTPSPTRADGNSTVYLNPRISANQLAQYMVADHAKQESIVQNARRAMTIPVANYNHARDAVPRSHDENGINTELFQRNIDRLSANPGNDDFDRECLRLSIRSLQRMLPLIGNIDAAGERITRPSRGFEHLLIEGVRLSVQPEIVFTFNYRGGVRYGGVMCNFASGAGSSLARTSGRYCAGDYAAFFVFQLLAIKFAGQGGPRYQNCVAVDVFRDTVHTAPTSGITMLRNVEAACRSIVRQWQERELADL